MSAFTVTMLYVLTVGIGFGIGYFFNKTNLKLWRVLVGFLVGFAVSWGAGVIIWALLFMSNELTAAIITGMAKSFLVALAGAGLGVYCGRRKAKQPEALTVTGTWVNPYTINTGDQKTSATHVPNQSALVSQMTASQVMGDDKMSGHEVVSVKVDEDVAYTQVANELETGKTDIGLWTRLFAACEGDEKKTKVLYIKQRAGKLIADERARLIEAAHIRLAQASEAEKIAEFDRREARLAHLGSERRTYVDLPKGICPHCDRVVPLTSNNCPRCGAIFGPSSAWSIRPVAKEEESERIKRDFLSDKKLTADDVIFLTVMAGTDSSLVSLTSVRGETLLHWAAKFDLKHEVSWLLRNGAILNAMNYDELTPLLLTQDVEIMNILSPSQSGQTAIPKVKP